MANYQSDIYFFLIHAAAIIANNLTGTITADIVTTDHKLKSTKAEVSYKVAGIEGFAVESGKFDVNFMSILEGAKIVNLDAKGAETSFVVNGSGTTFVKSAELKDGISLVTKDGKFNGIAGTGFTIDGKNSLVGANYVGSFDSKAGDKATASVSAGQLTVADLAAGTYSTTLTLTYKYGVKDMEVYVPMVITLEVNN